jgi:hypothetical protein
MVSCLLRRRLSNCLALSLVACAATPRPSNRQNAWGAKPTSAPTVATALHVTRANVPSQPKARATYAVRGPYAPSALHEHHVPENASPVNVIRAVNRSVITTAALGNGAMGIVEAGARYVVREQVAQKVAETTPLALYGVAAIPEKLGGGFIFDGAGAAYFASSFDAPLIRLGSQDVDSYVLAQNAVILRLRGKATIRKLRSGAMELQVAPFTSSLRELPSGREVKSSVFEKGDSFRTHPDGYSVGGSPGRLRSCFRRMGSIGERFQRLLHFCHWTPLRCSMKLSPTLKRIR